MGVPTWFSASSTRRCRGHILTETAGKKDRRDELSAPAGFTVNENDSRLSEPRGVSVEANFQEATLPWIAGIRKIRRIDVEHGLTEPAFRRD